MFAIDTNLLVYAHNTFSLIHLPAKAFVEQAMNQRDADGRTPLCLPVQVLMEFLHVITWQKVGAPLSLSNAVQIIQGYLDNDVRLLIQQPTQMQTFFKLLNSQQTRKKVFDVALAATLKDHGILEFYTVNVSDFEEFSFLDVRNPLIK